MDEVRNSVKEIVELIYGGGDLTSERSLLSRSEEGIKAHQYLQDKYKEKDQKEVTVSFEGEIDGINYYLTGRIDGVIKRSNKTIIEEIKSTTYDLNIINEKTTPAHLAQAKMYAYLYYHQSKMKTIYIRLTYINISSYKTKIIDLKYTFKEIEEFFFETIKEYRNFIILILEHEKQRNKSIKGLKFPYSNFRPGQRELMKECYISLLNKEVLYAIAPTGIGKTIAALFSGLKVINENSQKLFYLTAKNAGKSVVTDTVKLLKEHGLKAKTVEITAKDHVCFMETRDCDKDKCIYANGYYHRLYGAIKDIYANEDIFSKEIILEYAKKHQLCPFEFSLDISNYADIIIGDYNYAFCPGVRLVRYFEDDKYKPLLLVDEAHNLISRSRDMYSAKITRNMILSLKGKVRDLKPSPIPLINDIINIFDSYKEKLVNDNYFMERDYDYDLMSLVHKLYTSILEILDNESKKDISVRTLIPFKADIMNICFELYKYTKVVEFYSQDNFVYTIEDTGSDIISSIECLDASLFLIDTFKNRSYGSVLFSATLFPIDYYKKLLTRSDGNEVILPSAFNPYHLKLVIVDKISTKYRSREKSVDQIIETIHTLASSKKGNYIVFFPSYQYLNLVKDKLMEQYPEYEYIIQKRDLSMQEKEEYITYFKNEIVNTQIGLFVMGGMFAEGIDYIGDMLSGVIVVGCGLPAWGGYNNLLKSYFDSLLGSGYDYAYTYPGFSKVVQAVGRVIRTEHDKGVAILIDDRFSSSKYLKLFPRHWHHYQIINSMDYLKEELKMFWGNNE